MSQCDISAWHVGQLKTRPFVVLFLRVFCLPKTLFLYTMSKIRWVCWWGHFEFTNVDKVVWICSRAKNRRFFISRQICVGMFRWNVTWKFIERLKHWSLEINKYGSRWGSNCKVLLSFERITSLYDCLDISAFRKINALKKTNNIKICGGSIYGWPYFCSALYMDAVLRGFLWLFGLNKWKWGTK